MSNAYFQIGCTPTGTILKLYRETEGGAPIDPKEITEYLSSKNIMYNAAAIGKGVEEMYASPNKPDHLVLLNKDKIMEIQESYVLTSTPDKMVLTARFYPPSMKGPSVGAEEFKKDLAFKGVKFGIEEAAIDEFFKKKQYCTDVVVARGKEVYQGKNGAVEYYFNTDLSAKPAVNEDGSVDFFNLNTYTQCQEGAVLAKLFDPEPGEDGIDIFGTHIRPTEVRKKVLKHGRNIKLSEDEHQLIAEVSGHVSLVDDKVFLSSVMELDNVGTATGNIDFDGSILVLGNVNENFSVKAKGNVEVRGVVGGASIETEGDIIIARGMNGMGKGKLKAGGNIISKYLENVEASAGGFIQTELILHSTVEAGTEIHVSGRKGFIAGGRATAGDLIAVKTLGSDMGADTIIEVGMDPNVKNRMAELQKRIQENKKAIEQSKPAIATFAQKMQKGVKLSLDQKTYMQTLLTESKEKETQLKQDSEEFESLQKLMERASNARVEVTGDVYAGTKICISDVSMVVKSTMTYCMFKKDRGDVKMTSL